MATTALQLVDFIDAEGDPVYGLMPVHGSGEIDRVDEASVVHDAKSFQHVDYVFFRRFSDGRSIKRPSHSPLDNSREKLSEDSPKLHHQLWLHAAAPLMYVSWPSRIDILSCARGPDFWIDEDTSYEPADRINLPLDALGVASGIDVALKQRLHHFSALPCGRHVLGTIRRTIT